MKKKLLSALLSVAMVATLLVGCGAKEEAETAAPAATTEAPAAEAKAEEAAPAAEANGKKVGVAMPTQSSERWINDGSNMKKQLEALGYEVDLQYAEDDVQAIHRQHDEERCAGVSRASQGGIHGKDDAREHSYPAPHMHVGEGYLLRVVAQTQYGGYKKICR